MVARYIEIPRPPDGRRCECHSHASGTMRIAIFDVDGEVYAIEDACVRCAGPLSGGTVDRGQVTCPGCGWTYRLATGASTFLDSIRLHTFPVVVEPTRVLVECPAEGEVSPPRPPVPSGPQRGSAR